MSTHLLLVFPSPAEEPLSHEDHEEESAHGAHTSPESQDSPQDGHAFLDISNSISNRTFSRVKYLLKQKVKMTIDDCEGLYNTNLQHMKLNYVHFYNTG